MPAEQAQRLLQAWEDGRAASSGERGLILLGLARPTEDLDALCATLVGQRDAALMRLHMGLCGPDAHAIVACPRCDETLELGVPLAAVLAPAPEAPQATGHIELGERRLSYRLPTAGDLAALGASGAGSPATALAQLCLLGAEPEGGEVADDALAALEQAISEAVATEDPQAVVNLDLGCPACAHQWRSAFDIVEFLWSGLDGMARRLLSEVHRLALAYGWGETEILALPSSRRRYYLGLLGG